MCPYLFSDGEQGGFSDSSLPSACLTGFGPEPLPHREAFIDLGDGQAASVDVYRAPVLDDDLLSVQGEDAWTTAKLGAASCTVAVDVRPVVILATPAHQSSQGLSLSGAILRHAEASLSFYS